MEHSTPQDSSTPDAATDVVEAGNRDAQAERFNLSFHIPELQFRLGTAKRLEEKLRHVAMSAMEQTGKVKPPRSTLIGVRVHVQYQLTENVKNLTVPPEMVFNIGRTFCNAFAGIVYHKADDVAQLLVTKSYAEMAGIQVTIWEVQQ